MKRVVAKNSHSRRCYINSLLKKVPKIRLLHTARAAAAEDDSDLSSVGDNSPMLRGEFYNWAGDEEDSNSRTSFVMDDRVGRLEDSRVYDEGMQRVEILSKEGRETLMPRWVDMEEEDEESLEEKRLRVFEEKSFQRELEEDDEEYFEISSCPIGQDLWINHLARVIMT